jgi:glutaconate CoA-transferase subunit A
MARFAQLDEAITDLVHDGNVVAMEGFTQLIPFAAGLEIIRQGRRDLTLVRMAADILADQLIGMGCLTRLVFSWGGNPGVGLLNRLRDAIEHDWPAPLEIEEHSHFGLAARYMAGAADLPFMMLRGYAGNDLDGRSPTISSVLCPFTQERIAAVAAVRPDVTIVHAQCADRSGNIQLWGVSGVQKEAVLAARRSLVTVEAVVDTFVPRAGEVILPRWAIDTIAVVPNGAHPSYASGYSNRDDQFYRDWHSVSRDRDGFRAWMTDRLASEAVA